MDLVVLKREGYRNMESDNNIKTVSSINEKQTKQCRVCGEIKIRVLKGKFNKKDKKWMGISGGYWNGHVCPECHRKKCAERQRVKRAKS